jgi:DNA-binding MarR family transcriptional regulator
MSPASEFPRTSAWDRPGFLLWHATLRFQRASAAALAPLGITQTQFRLLASVVWLEENSDGPPSQRNLADHTGADAMMTSQVVRTLEKGGLIEREQDPSDSRVKRLRSTPSGRKVAVKAVRAIEKIDSEFFGAGAEWDDAVDVMRRLAGRDEHGELVDDRWQREP